MPRVAEERCHPRFYHPPRKAVGVVKWKREDAEDGAGETERHAVSSGDIEIVVERNAGLPGWTMHCQLLGIEGRPLPRCGTAQQAKIMAVGIVRERVSELRAHAERILNVTPTNKPW